MNDLKRFMCEEEAMGTVEVVLIAAVLIGIGLLFRDSVVNFVNRHLGQMDSVNVNVNNVGGSATTPAATTPAGNTPAGN